MGIYNIDFNQQAPELQPPDKRDAPTLALVTALLKGLQWCRDILFDSYKTGATAPDYSTGVYGKDAMVVYQKAVYLSLIANNTSIPGTDYNWQLVQDNFLGVEQRAKFNGQKVVLEYALNQQFGGVFRPPGSSSLSDIYIVNVAPVIAGFNVGQTEAYSQSAGQSTSSEFIGLDYPFVQIDNFQVVILSSIFATTTEKAVRNFIDRYIPISLNYFISTS